MNRLRLWIFVIGFLGSGWSVPAQTSVNLILNGSFDNPTNPLTGWMADYQWSGNSFYMDNHLDVSVIPKYESRQNVLRIHGDLGHLYDNGQGVKVDSKPIPYVPGSTYRLSLWGCKQADEKGEKGPNARILIEGYHWKPGIKPHPDPDLSELRKVYKQGAGHMICFSNKPDEKESAESHPQIGWKRAETVFPPKNLSKEGLAHLKLVQFLVVHIIAIDGTAGNLYVDDVIVEKIP